MPENGVIGAYGRGVHGENISLLHGLRLALWRPVPLDGRAVALGLFWPARPAAHALRADVRRLRARPGGRRHGAPAGGAAVRVAAHPERRAAALSPGTADHLCGSWRPRRDRGGRLPWFGFHSAALLLFGATLFLAHVARVLPGLDRAPAGWTPPRPAGEAPSGGYPLGVVLGFLPCGFLYAALATTAASGSPLLGALGMLAFGLGTAPR